mmetsp:Transcript_7080/g.15212  ORF Transcript_7080/g.15212 Transcript_7080/m.15212 type:complete len:176 (-) Transcript_7080:9-536(-)
MGVQTPQDVKKAIVPTESRNTRACLRCRCVLTVEQFVEQGCPNCQGRGEGLAPFSDMQDNPDSVYTATTAQSSGMVTVMVPSRSWVATYTGVDACKPGCYAQTLHTSLKRRKLETAPKTADPHVSGFGSQSADGETDLVLKSGSEAAFADPVGVAIDADLAPSLVEPTSVSSFAD